MKLVSLASVASVLLILIFVGKEALPVLTSAEVHKEITPGALFAPYARRRVHVAARQRRAEVQHRPALRRNAEGDTRRARRRRPAQRGVGRLRLRVRARRTCANTSSRPSSFWRASRRSSSASSRSIVLATWVQRVFGTEHRLNALVAGFGLAFAVCPVIFSVSEDALRAVPELVPDRGGRAGVDALADVASRDPAGGDAGDRGGRRPRLRSRDRGDDDRRARLRERRAARREPRALDADGDRDHRAGARRGRRRQSALPCPLRAGSAPLPQHTGGQRRRRADRVRNAPAVRGRSWLPPPRPCRDSAAGPIWATARSSS